MPNVKLQKFDWASNPYKLERAIENVGNKDEAKTKAEYIRLGGLVRNLQNVQYITPKPLYPWAANKLKLDRAINRAKVAYNTDGKPKVTEESIKAQYILIGGLVLKTQDDEIPPVDTKTEKTESEE